MLMSQYICRLDTATFRCPQQTGREDIHTDSFYNLSWKADRT